MIDDTLQGAAMHGPATDVFLSYKAEDRARLAPLVAALEHEGFSVWWDAHISGGTNWQEDIEQHLDAAKCVIVAWSKRSVGPTGNFVRDEARQALKRDAYVPVCLDPVEPPLGFRELQALPLKGWRGDSADPRFQAVAAAVRSHISGEYVPQRSHSHFNQPHVTRRAAIAGGATVAVAAAAGGWLLLKPAPAHAKRIAVLPFVNLSGDSNQAYFVEGIAEELRGALSRIGMEVIGRASSQAVKDLDTKVAAAKLGVSNILTGSVRRTAEIVRISAQLVSGNDGVERWGQSYDRAPGDEIKIQTDIATNVAQALSVALGEGGRAALTLGGTLDAAAQDLYLRARELINKVGDRVSGEKAIELIDAALARDPNYADAYRGKAVCLSLLGGNFPTSSADAAEKFKQSEAAARHAIAIAPRLGSNYVVLAATESARFDLASAVQNMRKGLLLSPNDPLVLFRASSFIELFGDLHRALELADRVIALDPLQGLPYARRAAILATSRDYPGSIAAWRKCVELDPKNSGAHSGIAKCLVLMNRPAEARAEYANAPPDDPLRLTGEAILAGRTRNLAEAKRIVARMRELFGDAASYQYAQIEAQSGNTDRAFAELDNAFHAKDPGLQELKTDPWLDPIRRDPRYTALLKRLNFPTWT